MHPALPADPAPAVAVCPQELAAHRAYLIRFAQRKLRDPALAEDAVHDVLEAVLAGRAAFGGRSALRSWLTGILKHKIVDLVRRDAEKRNRRDRRSGQRRYPPRAGIAGP